MAYNPNKRDWSFQRMTIEEAALASRAAAQINQNLVETTLAEPIAPKYIDPSMPAKVIHFGIYATGEGRDVFPGYCEAIKMIEEL